MRVSDTFVFETHIAGVALKAGLGIGIPSTRCGLLFIKGKLKESRLKDGQRNLPVF